MKELKNLPLSKEKIEEVIRFVNEEKNGTIAIILFGSYIKGLATEYSDVDICLISNNLSQNIFKRRYPCPSGYKYLSVFGFYPDEFIKYLKNGNSFVKEILKGKILYDNNFLSKIKDDVQLKI